MRCDDLTEVLAQAADGTPITDQLARQHVERCLRCQAELVQYRKLLRALRRLRTEVLEPAPGLLTEVLAGLEGAAERHAVRSLLSGRRVAYIGGIAAATAAAAGAGAFVLANRSRKRISLAG